MDIQDLVHQISRFEAEHAVRTCMNTYMTMCDTLDENTDIDKLANLFTTYAVWEGVGEYAKVLGVHNGREAIREMFIKYMTSPPHFSLNVHMLGNEKIDISASQKDAVGRWVLLQPSTFSSGDSQLSCAKITARFVLDMDGIWRMNSFQTERQFSRPMTEPWDSGNMPVPNTISNSVVESSHKVAHKTIPPKVKIPVQKQNTNVAPSSSDTVIFSAQMVTENSVNRLAPNVKAVVLEDGANITPLAMDKLKKRNIKIERVKS